MNTLPVRGLPPRSAFGIGRSVGVALLGVAALTPLAPGTAAGQAEDCVSAKVHCVDDTPGALQEYTTIQAAVNKAKKGHTVVVAPGDYAGFRVKRSGKANARIVIRAHPGARIVSPESRGEGVYLRRASYVTIQGFEVVGDGSMQNGIASHDASAASPVRGLEILDNTVHDTEQTGIYLSHAANSLVQGNIVYRSVSEHGIYLTNAGSDDTTLRDNELFENAINGLHFNGDEREGGDGVHTGLLIEGNRIHHNEANGIDADGVRDSTFANNLIYNNDRHGLRAFAIDAAAGPASLVIVNNTFVDNDAWAVKLTQDDGGHTVFNNILLSRYGSLVVGHPDVVSDYNVVQSGFSVDGEETGLSLAEWRALGHDLQSVRSRERRVFEAVNKDDFSLRGKSPAIDLGVAALNGAEAPATDILGSARPQGARPDAGAYERLSGAGRGRGEDGPAS